MNAARQSFEPFSSMEAHGSDRMEKTVEAASMYGGLSAAALAFYQDAAGVAHKLEAHVMWVDEKPLC